MVGLKGVLTERSPSKGRRFDRLLNNFHFRGKFHFNDDESKTRPGLKFTDFIDLELPIKHTTYQMSHIKCMSAKNFNLP